MGPWLAEGSAGNRLLRCDRRVSSLNPQRPVKPAVLCKTIVESALLAQRVLCRGSFRSWVGLRMEPVSVTLTLGDCSFTAALQGDYLVLRATDSGDRS